MCLLKRAIKDIDYVVYNNNTLFLTTKYSLYIVINYNTKIYGAFFLFYFVL